MVHGIEKAGWATWNSDGCTVARDERSGARDRAAREGCFRRRPRILRRHGAEEIQAARPRHVKQVSRVCGVSGVPGTAAARRSSRGADSRIEHLPGCGADDYEGEGLLFQRETAADAG